MPTIVTIKSTAPAEVISERIVDGGRERHENGRDLLAADEEQSFIVHAGQSVRVVEFVPAAPVAETEEKVEAPEAGTQSQQPAEGAAA